MGAHWRHHCSRFFRGGRVCKRHDLFLIEDAAHAHGSRIGGISAGNIGDSGAFPSSPRK